MNCSPCSCILFFTLLLVPAISALAQRPPVKVVAPDRMYFDVGGEVLSLPYYSSRPLTQPDASVTRLVISQHGASRNADAYFERMMKPAAQASALDYTVVVAPQFLEAKDIQEWNLDPDVLYFTSDAWKGGAQSSDDPEHSRVVRLSAFDVMDRLLLRCVHLFPNLETIVLAGHSAGGQYMNRYSAANTLDLTLQQRFGIDILYIVANPSSYVYFTEERPIPGRHHEYAVPDETVLKNNPAYNVYKYGLDEIPLYWQRTGVDRVMKQFPHRRVVYLLGEEDNDPNHGSLDKRSGSMMQGNTRLHRGINYFGYIGHVFGEDIYKNHRIAILPGVGHSSGDVFASPGTMYYLFEYGQRTDGPLENYDVRNLNPRPGFLAKP